MFKNIIVIVSMVVAAACGEQTFTSEELTQEELDEKIESGERYGAADFVECCTCIFECEMNKDEAAKYADQIVDFANKMGIADIESYVVGMCTEKLEHSEVVNATATCVVETCATECEDKVRYNDKG